MSTVITPITVKQGPNEYVINVESERLSSVIHGALKFVGVKSVTLTSGSLPAQIDRQDLISAIKAQRQAQLEHCVRYDQIIEGQRRLINHLTEQVKLSEQQKSTIDKLIGKTADAKWIAYESAGDLMTLLHDLINDKEAPEHDIFWVNIPSINNPEHEGRE